MSFKALGIFYRDLLLDDLLPFWERYAIDWEKGGIFTAITDRGEILSQDKYIWSNTRAVYTFAAAYNEVQKNQKWLEIAANIFEFCYKFGIDQEGRWNFLTDREGKVKEGGDKAIVVDAFAIMGLTEYAKATGDSRAVDLALSTWNNTRERLKKQGSYGTHPYLLPAGLKAHRYSMQFSFAYWSLGSFLKRDDILKDALYYAEDIMDHFRNTEKEGLTEYITVENSFSDTPEGRTMNPGHVIESMWFMIHVFDYFGRKDRVLQAVEVIRWALEKGWDHEYGGLFLAVDIKGGLSQYWKFPDKKVWWVFSETLYALLRAYKETGEDWCIEWYAKVHAWSFKYFPVPEYGEWTNKLNRDGTPFDGVVALPVKDPFHLPRAVIRCIKVLEELSGETS